MQDVKLEYQKREARVRDAVALKEPDRVPIIPVMEAFPIYYGGKTIKFFYKSQTVNEFSVAYDNSVWCEFTLNVCFYEGD